MTAWRTLLAGLVVWLIHFAIVYALPSLEAIGAGSRRGLILIHGLATVTGLALVGFLALTGWRKARVLGAEREAFGQRVAALGAGLAGIAMVWQALPAWLS